MSGKCRSCGEKLNDKGICPVCGDIQEGASDMTGASYIPQQGAAYKAVQSRATSVSGWIGWLLLCFFLPIVGCILTAFSAPDRSVKNFAKAMLIFWFLAIVIGILIYVAFGSMFVGLLGGASGQVKMNM